MCVACQLFDLYAIIDESFLEISHDFRDKSFHGCDVDDFECFGVNLAILLASMVSHDLKNGKHGNVGLASACRSTDQQVLS